MRCLIAILTCHKFRGRADAQRRTWVPIAIAAGYDVKFFLGAERREPFEDEIFLECPDDYKSLRLKTQLALKWACGQGYDFILKLDDDVYVIPDNLRKTFNENHYSGRLRGPSRENDAPRIYGDAEQSFCSGFGYWLSSYAAQIVIDAPDNGDWAEDRFVGNMLARRGINPQRDTHFLLWPQDNGHACRRAACAYCAAAYASASVICPYVRPEVIELMHVNYAGAGRIPTCL